MIRTLWQKHRLASLLFLGALLVAAFFAVRLTMFTIYWSDPARREQPIEGWMTPGYVAMSWDVPKPIVAEAAGLSGTEGRRIRLDDIAAERGIPLEALIDEIEGAIQEFKSRER